MPARQHHDGQDVAIQHARHRNALGGGLDMRRAADGLYQCFAVMRPSAANQRAVDIKKHKCVGLFQLYYSDMEMDFPRKEAPLVVGDITKIRVDAAIHRAGGPHHARVGRIRTKLADVPRQRRGHRRRIASSAIRFHAWGPSTTMEARRTGAVAIATACLDLAEQHGVRTISFPPSAPARTAIRWRRRRHRARHVRRAGLRRADVFWSVRSGHVRRPRAHRGRRITSSRTAESPSSPAASGVDSR